MRTFFSLSLILALTISGGCNFPEIPDVPDATPDVSEDEPDMSESTPDIRPMFDTAPDREVASVEISPAMPVVVLDETLQLSATLLDEEGAEVVAAIEWSSSDSSIIDVATSGIVIGAGLGTATVTATAQGVSGSVEVRVVPVPVAAVDVAPKMRSMEVGDTVQIQVTLTDVNGGLLDASERVVSYSTDDESVVSVDDAGLVTAVGPGEATVTVTSEGVSATSTFTVSGPELESIEIAPSSARLVPGDTASFGVSFVWVDDEPGPEPPVSWVVGDDTVATVDDTGLVTAVGEGSTTVTVSGAGLDASATVDVIFDFEAITVGGAHACGLVEGVAFCWGANADGQLGHADGPAPGRVDTDLRFRSISAGASHTCAVTTSDEAHCWGANTEGQLGNGSSMGANTPTPVSGMIDFASISAGAAHTCGVDTSGGLHCWGLGDDGRLGTNSTMSASSPVAVTGQNYQQVFAGGRHTCATTSGDMAFCWGDNDDGQLGRDFRSAFESGPGVVTGGFDFNRFGLGDSHSVGVTTSGAAAGWGLNDSGQVGDASNAGRKTPILLPGNPALARLVTGDFHSCGLTSAGDAYCWGEGGSGQLGTGNTSDQNEATAVDTTLQFSALDAGADFTCGITTDADVYCWGEGSSGQLGSASTGSMTPVSVF